MFTGTGISIDKELTQKSTIIFRTVPFEYGHVDWVFGIKFLYETLLQEERLYMYMYILRNILPCKYSCVFREEYLICDFACVLSNIGGYLGLFFGVSLLDLIFTFELIIK